jgi:glucosamine-6-phosphate deaminase
MKILKGTEDLGSVVADIVEHTLTLPQPKLILPTGSTSLSLYKELVNRELDWSTTTTFNLDEYVINPNHPQSYNSFMKKHLFDRVNIYPDNCHFPFRPTEAFEAKVTESLIIDLCILGIGSNGHIAFNEPGSSFKSRTRVVNLSEQTIQDNSRFFDSVDDVPKQAITMGLGTIMESKKIVLMVNGEHKKDILDIAMNGEVTEDVPASILQNHDNVEVLYCE